MRCRILRSSDGSTFEDLTMFRRLCALVLACVACSTASMGEDGLMCRSEDRDRVAFDYEDPTDWTEPDPISAVELQLESDLPGGSTFESGEGTDVTLVNRDGQPVAHITTLTVDGGYVADSYTACPGVLPYGS